MPKELFRTLSSVRSADCNRAHLLSPFSLYPPSRRRLSSWLRRSGCQADPQAAELMAGKWYVNVRTAAYPGGEIRGQVVKGN